MTWPTCRVCGVVAAPNATCGRDSHQRCPFVVVDGKIAPPRPKP